MKGRILVVNDTQEILEMFRAILEEEEYEVVLSSTAFQNLAVVEQIKPDLIIIDIIFDDQKVGWQMLQLLKMNAATVDIPVIVCSAAERAVREQEGYLVSQGVLVVFKPFDLDMLLSTVTKALQTRKNTPPHMKKEQS